MKLPKELCEALTEGTESLQIFTSHFHTLCIQVLTAGSGATKFFDEERGLRLRV